uniref:4Fe-4S single cluster domain protein n=1 Tax=Siphoviridae sp. cttFh17 TaxID=2826491 RepID=A0A8S5NIR7_9CAUD|nr:MAG TPA: 4Fe-4S single cluster domain protein [Siphoviridae sp. cttFh17]
MRYSSIRNLDISNGEGVGVSLFVQGCDRHCFNCFNSETWDFNGGKEWTEETKNKFMELIDRPYINRISVLGGEPLAEQNLDEVLSLIKEIHSSFPEKTIWLYTGFRWNYIMNYQPVETDGFDYFDYIEESYNDGLMEKRKQIISLCDVVIDGEYIDEQKDLTLKWRGSKNQNCIDAKQSLAQNKVVLYCD